MQFKIKNWQIQNEALVLGVVRKFKDWDYEIKKFKKDRTTQQNRYYGDEFIKHLEIIQVILLMNCTSLWDINI